MPNPGKSLAELKKTGTYQKHPARYRAKVEAAEGFVPLGDPPAHLDAHEKAAWDEIRRKAPAGTLAESDFILAELAARLLAKSRHDRANFTPTDSRTLQGIANDLGMSPLKRGKVTPHKEKPESRFATLEKLLNGRSRGRYVQRGADRCLSGT